jgi:hypothetical protein
VLFAMEINKASDGGKVGIFGAEAEVLEAQDGAHLFQKSVDTVHGVSFDCKANE